MPVTILTPQSIRNLGVYGIIRQAEVDDHLIPDGAVTEAINVHFDRKGAVTLRLGVAGLGATVAAGYPIWSLYNTQTGSMLVSISQGGSARIYTYGGAAWTSNLTGGTANIKCRYTNYAGKVILTNFGYAGNQYDSIRFWNEITDNDWATTGNPINPQQLWPYRFPYIEVYKNRVYVAGDLSYPGRLFYSSVINSAGNINWDTSSTGYWVDINPSDGENITALKRFSLDLLVFKPNYIYRFRTSGIDPDPLIKIGTRSQDSVIEGKSGIYFHHESGFYRYSGDFLLEEISRPISDIVEAITYTFSTSVAAWKDSDHIYWSIGNITINGIAWTNVVLRYTESSQLWTVYQYANLITNGSTYNSSAAISKAVGTYNGLVGTVNSGYTDFGQPIAYRMITKWYEWDNIVNQKVLQNIFAYCEKAQDSKIFYQVDDEYKWEEFGAITKFLNEFKNLNKVFSRIRFKLAGVSTKEPMVFLGLETPEGLNEGIINK